MNEHFTIQVESLIEDTQLVLAQLQRLLHSLTTDGHNPRYDGFDQDTVIVPNACRHAVPVGDWCSYCAETPEG